MARAFSDIICWETRRPARGAVASPGRPLTEGRMRKAAFAIFGALLIAGSTMQMASASEHHTRTGRSHHRWDRAQDQLREPSYAAPKTAYNNYGKPSADETRTCALKCKNADCPTLL